MFHKTLHLNRTKGKNEMPFIHKISFSYLKLFVFADSIPFFPTKDILKCWLTNARFILFELFVLANSKWRREFYIFSVSKYHSSKIKEFEQRFVDIMFYQRFLLHSSLNLVHVRLLSFLFIRNSCDQHAAHSFWHRVPLKWI